MLADVSVNISPITHCLKTRHDVDEDVLHGKAVARSYYSYPVVCLDSKLPDGNG